MDGYNGRTLGVCEIYDPARNAWATLSQDPVSRWGGVAVSLGKNRILVLDGYRSDYLASLEEFFPLRGVWEKRREDPTPREKPVAVRLPNGKVLVLGGLNAGGFVSSLELYDPYHDVWKTLPRGTSSHRQKIPSSRKKS
jgi:N-acetylneuraminic acid mutarotase